MVVEPHSLPEMAHRFVQTPADPSGPHRPSCPPRSQESRPVFHPRFGHESTITSQSAEPWGCTSRLRNPTTGAHGPGPRRTRTE